MPQDAPKHTPTLSDIAEESGQELLRFRAVFPFDLFPDEIVIDSQSITIVHHLFFLVKQKVICHFDDLAHSEVNVGPLFGSIRIYSKYFVDGEERIGWLSRNAALKLHAIAQGVLIARKEGVSLKSVPKEELMDKLYKIGNHRD